MERKPCISDKISSKVRKGLWRYILQQTEKPKSNCHLANEVVLIRMPTKDVYFFLSGSNASILPVANYTMKLL